MRIGEVAAATDTTTKTIRYYESIGLLPEPPRSTSGYRSYDEAAVDRLRFIRESQASGLSLTEISSILALKDAGATTCEHTAGLLRRHVEDLDAQIASLQRARAELVVLAERAATLDPGSCTDPNRCQVLSSSAPEPSAT
ncbi:MAG: MerR family transcriptional regulator [Ilumatobacter sp.]